MVNFQVNFLTTNGQIFEINETSRTVVQTSEWEMC